MPTLYEALKAMKGRALVDLDLKTGDLEPIISRVIETDMLEQALFFNGNYASSRSSAPSRRCWPSRGRIRRRRRRLPRRSSSRKPSTSTTASTPMRATGAMASDSRAWINALGDPDKLVAQGKGEGGDRPAARPQRQHHQTDHPAAVIAYLKSIGRR